LVFCDIDKKAQHFRKKYLKMKLISIDELTDEIVGKKGTPHRDLFEYELKMNIIGDIIKEIRENKKITK